MSYTDSLGIGNLMSDKQIISIARSDARINVFDGAIRSGKTIASLFAFLMYVATAPKGELLVCARTTHAAYRNIFVPLMDDSLFGEISKSVKYTNGAPTATILGRTVHVIGANDARAEQKLRGFTCAGAYIDEATLVGKDFFTQVLGRMSVPGAQLFTTTNPDSPSHWLKTDFIDRASELDLRRFHYVLDDNPVLSEDYKESIKHEFTGLYYKRFIMGEWVAADGAVYDMWDYDRHVVSELPTIVEWVSVGIDYGTTNALHAVLLGLGIDNVLYVVSEYRYDSKLMHAQKTDGEYSVDLRTWLDNITVNGIRIVARPKTIELDPSAASFRAQLFLDGMVPHKADNSVLDGIRVVSQLLGTDKLKIHESCVGLIGEMSGYSWDARQTERGEDKPLKVADHGVDALRYAVYTTRFRWRSKVGLKTIPAA